MKKVSFETSDAVTIVGNYWSGGKNGVVLLHMMPATKESWNEFANDLYNKEFSILAIDLRGHGESTSQGSKTLNYKTFNDTDHQASINDVDAAVEFLKKQGVTNVDIVGASIGANLAIWYQAEHPDIKKTVLLSPGTNYRGILTEPFAAELLDTQKVYLVAGTQDMRSAGGADAMAKQIANNIKGEAIVKTYESAAHGTDLFAVDPILIETLVKWLREG